jgi:hypothetical protein
VITGIALTKAGDYVDRCVLVGEEGYTQTVFSCAKCEVALCVCPFLELTYKTELINISHLNRYPY